MMKKWFGKRCSVRVGKATREVLVFDFAHLKKRREFVDALFGDCQVPGDFPEWLERSARGLTTWKHPSVVPFALENPADEDFIDGLEHPQFDALWVTDLAKSGPVYRLDVDGSVQPAKRPSVSAKSLTSLTFTAHEKAKPKKGAAPDFAEHALLPALRGAGPGAALELLHRIRGGKGQDPKAPKGRDPRWVGALQAELEAAMWAENSFVQMLGAAVASFPGAAPVVAAQTLASIAKTAPGHLRTPFLTLTNMLLAAKSNVAADDAVTILERHELDDGGGLLLYLRLHGQPRHLPRLRKLASSNPELRRVMEAIQDRFAEEAADG